MKYIVIFCFVLVFKRTTGFATSYFFFISTPEALVSSFRNTLRNHQERAVVSPSRIEPVLWGRSDSDELAGRLYKVNSSNFASCKINSFFISHLELVHTYKHKLEDKQMPVDTKVWYVRSHSTLLYCLRYEQVRVYSAKYYVTHTRARAAHMTRRARTQDLTCLTIFLRGSYSACFVSPLDTEDDESTSPNDVITDFWFVYHWIKYDNFIRPSGIEASNFC